MTNQPFHSDFTCFVGRPNAGKSTLTNALVGQKIAIASSKPQATRHTVQGVVTCDSGQLVLIDTPGLHRPHTLLGGRLNEIMHETWSEVDVVGVYLPRDQRIGPGDRCIVSQIAESSSRPPLVALATKTDLVNKERVLSRLMDISALADRLGIQWAEVVPCSASNNDQVDMVRDMLLHLLPGEPMYYPNRGVTDEPEETPITELIREAALEEMRDKLPHPIAVVIDEILPHPDRPEDKPLPDVFASIVMERNSQRGIIIERKGSRLRGVETATRLQINRLLSIPVHLSLHVKVLREWQRGTECLNRLGF